MMTDTNYLKVKLALDAFRYNCGLVEWDDYFEIMNDQDGYYDIADKVADLMSKRDRDRLEWGDLPKWLTDCFTKYELENFGDKATNHF